MVSNAPFVRNGQAQNLFRNFMTVSLASRDKSALHFNPLPLKPPQQFHLFHFIPAGDRHMETVLQSIPGLI